jgi:hypothetical protein
MNQEAQPAASYRRRARLEKQFGACRAQVYSDYWSIEGDRPRPVP